MQTINRWLIGLALLWALTSAHAGLPVISQQNNECLSVGAASQTLKVLGCSSTAAQSFEFTAGGTVLNGGICLDLQDTAGTAGTAVILSACTGKASQIWKRDGDFLVSMVKNLCLRRVKNIKGEPVRPGSMNAADVLKLDSCAYDADRKWTFGATAGALPTEWPAKQTDKPSATVSGSSLNSVQLRATVNWIYAETKLDSLPFCWKKAGYDRGIGIAPSECPAGKRNEGGLCYDPPRDGYGCTAMTCSEGCRSGYSSSGFATCHYTGGPTTYTKKPHARPINGCQKSRFQSGGFCYDREDNGAHCRDNYAMKVDGICSFQGAWDIGRNTYSRAGGTLPTGCLSNRIKQDGMCYLPPNSGFSCAATVCTQHCAAGTLACGAGCARDVGTCTSSIVDMVVSPAMALASLATAGAAGEAANGVRAAAGKARQAFELGANAAQLALILRDAITSYMQAAEGHLADIATPEVERAVAAKYGKGSPNYRAIVRQYALVQILAAVRDMFLELDVLAVSMIDPTGVVATISAFAKPPCEQHKAIP